MYPVSLVWEEVQLVVERHNMRLATETTLLNTAIGTAVAAFGEDGGAKARREFAALIKTLSSGGSPEPTKKKMADLVEKDRRGNGR